LHEPAKYQIEVPGYLDATWSSWARGMTITLECKGGGQPVTTLTGTLDQAALHGLLRRLYSIDVPLLSVNRIEPDKGDALDVT
jgi:hypothetical protein